MGDEDDEDTQSGAGAPPDLPADPPTDPLAALPEDELRLALVLNGGVSLAVWMGGVALEIDRLTRAAAPEDGPGTDGAYRPLLAATRSRTTVDVITGTSAGGINGAALAVSQANRDADLRLLRGVWAEQGRMEELLRRPFQGSPTALLRGDDYFLPALHRAMRMLALPCTPRVEDRATPMDLTLTTTLLHGDQRVDVDDFGKRMPQRVHAATFRFSNVTPDGPADPPADPFHPDRIAQTSDALALAARCTASFPFAFEPVFVPVGEESPDPRLRPRMDAHASWARDGVVQSRYAVDGGVLANTPLSQALDAIDRRQADGPVRRAMLLVYPHAPDEVEQEPDTTEDVPTAIGSLASVFGALHGHASRSLVERVEEHNRAAAAWHGSREQLLTGFGDAGPDAVLSVYDLLDHAWPHYRHIRIRSAAAGLVDKVARPEQWSYERVRGAAESAQRRWLELDGIDALPYVPATFGWQDPAWRGEHLTPGQWTWGDTPARGVFESIAAVLRSALAVVSDPDARADLAAAREAVGAKSAEILRLRRVDIDRMWLDDPYLMELEPDEDYWTARVIAYGRAMQPMDAWPGWSGVPEVAELLPRRDGFADARGAILDQIDGRTGATGQAVAQLVREGVELLAGLSDHLATLATTVGDLADWWAFLFSAPVVGEPADPTDRLLLRLLALDAATRMMSDGTTHGGNLPVQLAELSLKIDHPWARHSTGPTDKVAGMQLARFGGFLKQSWRMNDWTWGRLDAVTMLCQVVLNPARIRRLRDMVSTSGSGSAADFPRVWFDRLRDALYPGGTPPSYAQLEQDARDEVVQALGDDADGRLYLPSLARWAALPLQAQIILEELPILESAIRIDVTDGAGANTRGTRFLAEHADSLMARIKAPPPGTDLLDLGCEALRVFDTAGIGREQLGDETGSDSLIRTVSTAAGVLATVVDSDAAKVPAVTPVTSSVRGALLLPYWMIHGLASGGRVARFLASGALVIGGVLLALSLLGVLGGAAAAAGTAGAAAVLSALAYSALKTGSLLHALALLSPVGPLIFYAVRQGDSEAAAGTRVLIVLSVALGLSFLARIPWPLGSPSAAIGRLWRRRRAWLLAGGALVALVLVVVTVSSVRRAVWSWVLDVWAAVVSVGDEVVALIPVDVPVLAVQAAAAAVVAGVGALITRQQTRQLRTWRVAPGSTATYAPDHDTVTGLFDSRWLAHPTGVAASWAPVYGAAYLLLALVLAHLPAAGDETWEGVLRFTLGWFVVLGVALCLVVPVALARAQRRAVLRSITRSWPGTRDPLGSAEPSDVRRLLHLLLKRDLGYHYLLSPASDPASDRASDQASSLALSGRGDAVLRELTGREG